MSAVLDHTFVLYVATSLDGYIATADGSVAWLDAFATADMHDYERFYATVDALVMGATTYEQILTFGDWPYPGKPSYVLTRRSLTSPRDDVAFVATVRSLLQILESQPQQRIWIVGGAQVAAVFMAKGLIDEYILTVMPIMLGGGISLYQNVPQQRLNLVASQPYPSGAIELHYRRATKVEPGLDGDSQGDNVIAST